MAGSYDVRGRTVLITGAARGIGAETARRLAARGARVALVGIEPEKLEALAGELGGDAACFEADVRDEEQVNGAVAAVAERFGGIDVVMANAGVPPPVTTVELVKPEDFARVIDINLLGVFRTVHAALPHVIERRGYVLNIASLAAAVHAPMMASYNASKAAVEAFSNGMRTELSVKGVAVGVAYFGFIDTDMVRESFDQPGSRRMREEVPSRFTKPLPVGRAADGIVRGIERRARRVVVPSYIWPLVLFGSALEPIIDRGARNRILKGALDDVERAADQTPA
ncbi:MAG TPA: short-chain dehydrogenase/reductase [Solirubrobacteraceae bacterium]